MEGTGFERETRGLEMVPGEGGRGSRRGENRARRDWPVGPQKRRQGSRS